jgi:glycosyltransferase involved in cell wall biosynthesis
MGVYGLQKNEGGHTMRLFNVMFTTLMGGLEQAFLDYTEALMFCGHEVVSLIHTQSAVTDKVKGTYHKVHSFSKHDPFSVFKLKKLVKELRPDVIITHGNRAHCLMQKSAGTIPIVGVSHDLNFGQILRSHAIICVSEELKDQYLAKRTRNNQKIIHIPNMIKLPQQNVYRSPRIGQAEYTKPIIIGVVARLCKRKGIDVFVKSLAELKSKNIPFKAKIAGDGVDYTRIKTLIQELNLTEDVEMLGWIETSQGFYDSIDIFCVPSLTEPFGIVVLEGLASCVPLISSDASGPMEIVQQGRDALVFPKGDHHQLAVCIERLLKDPELALKLTKKGFETVQKYDIRTVSQSINGFMSHLETVGGNHDQDK